MNFHKFGLLCAVFVFLSSCASQKVIYFEDMTSGTQEKVLNVKDIRVRPEDKISILVNSKNPQITNLFNLPYVTQQLGTIEGETMGTPKGVSGYTIDKDGYISFPILGKVYVEGMNREEIASHIASELISNDLIKEPVVTVEFMNLTVSILGEVNQPGRYKIDKDKLTLLEALSMAGDLTIFGKREKVMVQREEDGKQKLYQVDLTSGYNLYASPVYYLQQNDVVYVEPNKHRAKDATVNNKALRWSSIWIAIASLISSITIAIVK